MTVKEVSKILGISEGDVEYLVKHHFVDSFEVLKPVYDDNYFLIGYRKHYEVEPEEVDYIDWFVNSLTHEQRKEVYITVATNLKDKPKNKDTFVSTSYVKSLLERLED